MNKIVIFTITALSSALMACSSAPTSNTINYGVPFVNRTLPERMIDEGIEHTVLRNLPNVPGMENIQNHQMRMAVDSFRREVLLTGEVPNQMLSQNIYGMIDSMHDVNKIYNYLTVGVPKTQAHTLQDNVLKSRILARLVTDRSIKASQYKLVVRDSTVYVMGYMTQDQQNRIMEAIRQTQGVGQVVLLSNLVTYLDTNSTPSPYVNTNYNNTNNFGNNVATNNGFNNTYNNSNMYGNNTYDGNAYGTNNLPTNTLPINNTSYNNPTPYNQNLNNTVARPTSSYVQLYSGTNQP